MIDYPDIETHELLCNHLAPKLKGRPRGRRKKMRSDSPSLRLRTDSPDSGSMTSEVSACSVEKVSFFFLTFPILICDLFRAIFYFRFKKN